MRDLIGIVVGLLALAIALELRPKSEYAVCWYDECGKVCKRSEMDDGCCCEEHAHFRWMSMQW
jgi:hypothetical protein